MKAKIHLYVRGKEFTQDQKQIIRRVTSVLQAHDLYVQVTYPSRYRTVKLRSIKSA